MKEYILKTERILLRKTEPDDIDFVINIESDPGNAQFINQWTREEHLNAINNKDIVHMVIETSDEKSIGFLILAGVDNNTNQIEFKRLVIAEQGKGYGKETIGIIKKLSFEQYTAQRLWINVREKDERSRHVFKTQGFNEVGKLKDYIKINDVCESVIVISMMVVGYRTATGG